MLMIAALLILFGTIIGFYLYVLIRDDFNSSIERLSQNIHKTSEVFLEQLKRNISLDTDAIMENPQVKIAFDAQDRETLLAYVLPYYKKMNDQNPYIKIMTFRLADGSAFLRVHKPEMFGDLLHENRKIIIDTNRFRERTYGFEVGKLKMTYRVVTPIFYQDNYIGLVEIGIEPEYLTNMLDDIFKIEGALFIRNDGLLHVSTHMKKEASLFVLVRGDSLFKRHIDEIDLNFQQGRTLLYEGKNYRIDDDLNLLNHEGRTAAKILVAYEIDSYLNKVNEMVMVITLYIILLIIIVLFILNYFLLEMDKMNKKLSLKSREMKGLNDDLEKRVADEVEKNREKDKQLLQQSRMAQMGEMMSMIAHQWRQPLTAISATSSLLELKAKMNKLDQETVEKKAKEISSYSQHLSHTIDDFRDFFKPNKELSKTNYDEIVQSVLGMIEISIINKNIVLHQELNCHGQFSTYLNELKQVLLNLIKNAEEVLLEEDVQEPYIKIVTYKDDNKYILEVSDNGGGVPEAIIEKVFDPYFSTKGDKNGTGLGLYMSKIIIEEHCNGELRVSNSRHGAVFSIILTQTIHR